MKAATCLMTFKKTQSRPDRQLACRGDVEKNPDFGLPPWNGFERIS